MSTLTALGKLPNPFVRPDGSVISPEQWWEERKALRRHVVELEFGTLPPRPDRVVVEPLNDSPVNRFYRLHLHCGERTHCMTLHVNLPGGSAPRPYPVLLTGDGCFAYCNDEVVKEANERGYAVVRFNRLELAADRPTPRSGGLYDVFPAYTDFTAIAAWAWGYSAVIDALEQLPMLDTAHIGATGHSRGGKTVLLAAACDERIRYVCPNGSGTHGCALYRYVLTDGEGAAPGAPNRSERLSDLITHFPHWISPALHDMAGREDTLPYDMHYFGALIAPRYYFQTEGLQDLWANPPGSYLGLAAVRACYAYLGCEEHVGCRFRQGTHAQKPDDFAAFLTFMDRARAGLDRAPEHVISPFPDLHPEFQDDLSCPYFQAK